MSGINKEVIIKFLLLSFIAYVLFILFFKKKRYVEGQTNQGTSAGMDTLTDEEKAAYTKEWYGDKGSKYRGKVSKTISGKTCQNWALQTPHIHSRCDSNDSKATTRAKAVGKNCDYSKSTHGIGDHNYCRNPDSDSTARPWCYTNDKNTRWELCSWGELKKDGTSGAAGSAGPEILPSCAAIPLCKNMVEKSSESAMKSYLEGIVDGWSWKMPTILVGGLGISNHGLSGTSTKDDWINKILENVTKGVVTDDVDVENLTELERQKLINTQLKQKIQDEFTFINSLYKYDENINWVKEKLEYGNDEEVKCANEILKDIREKKIPTLTPFKKDACLTSCCPDKLASSTTDTSDTTAGNNVDATVDNADFNWNL